MSFLRNMLASLPAALVLVLAAHAAEVGTLAVAQAPQVTFTRQAGVVFAQQVSVNLETGSNRFAFDFGRYDIDPATVELRVLQPAEGVRLAARELPARRPGQAVFVLEAQQATAATVRLTYVLKGLEAEVAYTALLSPAQSTLILDAQLTLRNNGKQPLSGVQMRLVGGHRLSTDLAVGESLQQRLFRCEGLPYQVANLYDLTRFKESPHALVTLARQGSESFDNLSLPAGKLRAFRAGVEPPTLIAETAVKYTPAHEPLELDLGPIPEVSTQRLRLRGDQVNTRSDVYKKLVMFDLEEEWELQLQNHRPTPVTLYLDEHIAGEWQILKSSVPYEKLEAGTARFTLTLGPGEKTKFSYVSKRLNVEP